MYMTIPENLSPVKGYEPITAGFSMGYPDKEDPAWDDCLPDAKLVRFPLNRLLKLSGMLLSGASVPLLAYVIKKFILGGCFHPNIRLILYSYFIVALLQAAALSLSLGYMITLSYSSESCGIFLNQTVYIVGHLINFYLVFAQVNLQTVACLERIIATIFTTTYSKYGSTIGVFLSLLALLTPVGLMYAIYFDEDFVERQPSVVIPPDSVKTRINLFCIYCIFFCVFSLILLNLLNCYNRKKARELIGQVDSRFQNNENLSTTGFITLIIGLQECFSVSLSTLYFQLSFYLSGFAGILVMRLTDHLYSKYNLTMQTLKTCLFLVPVFLIFLPLVTRWEFTRVKRNRQKLSMDQVFIKTTGEEGVQNYQRVIYDLWS